MASVDLGARVRVWVSFSYGASAQNIFLGYLMLAYYKTHKAKDNKWKDMLQKKKVFECASTVNSSFCPP